MINKYISNVMFIILLTGCSSSLDERYVGTTQHYYRRFNSNDFISNNYYPTNSSECITKGEQFDIRLDSQIFNQSFDGIKENFSEGSFFNFNKIAQDTNEIGIFLTIQELSRDLNTNSLLDSDNEVESRLIYTSFSRKPGQPLNQKNKLVYSGKYNGGDLRFIIQVREFDKENGSGVMNLINIISEEAAKYTQAANPLVGNLLDKIGTATKANLFRDDVIASFDMEFVPCDIYPNKNQVYLSEGQILFLRSSQDDDFDRESGLKWDGEHNILTDKNGKVDKSYTSFYIYRRKSI